MKRNIILALAVLILASVQASAQYDWANFGKYAAENKLKYIDYYSVLKDSENGLPSKWSYDGVHLNAAGYEVIEEMILKVLK